jgi:hypothetical protein
MSVRTYVCRTTRHLQLVEGHKKMDQASFTCKQIHDIPLQATYKRCVWSVWSHTPIRPRMTPPRTPKAIAIGSEMRSSRALRRKRPSSHIQEHDLSSSCMMCVCVWGGAGDSVIQQLQDLYSRLKSYGVVIL